MITFTPLNVDFRDVQMEIGKFSDGNMLNLLAAFNLSKVERIE